MTPTLTPEALAHTDALLARLQGVGHLTADQLESWWASRRGVRRVELFRLLRHLVDDGRVVALSGRRWGLPSTTPPEPSSTTAAPRPVPPRPVAAPSGSVVDDPEVQRGILEKALDEALARVASLAREGSALRTRHDDTRLRFCSALNMSAQTEWNEILDRVRHQRDALATCARERDEAARRLATRTAERDEALRERDDLLRLLETPPAPAPRPRPTTAAKPTPKTDPRKVPVPGTVAARILASLRRGPKDTATLQARLDLPAPTVRGRLSELATGGWVAKGLNGAWEVIG